MQQAKALKEKVDTARHREAVLKVRIQPWIDEAFVITTTIVKPPPSLAVFQLHNPLE